MEKWGKIKKRHKSTYPGDFYGEAERVGDMGRKRVYYIVFKEDGKFPEEKGPRRWGKYLIPLRRKRTGNHCPHRPPTASLFGLPIIP